MPPRALVLDLGNCQGFICRSCLVSLRRQAPRPWLSQRSFSRSVRTAAGARKEKQSTPSTVSPPDPADDSNVTIRLFNQDKAGNLQPLRDEAEMADTLNKQVEVQLGQLEGKVKDMIDMMKRLGDSRPEDGEQSEVKDENHEDEADQDLSEISKVPLDTRLGRHAKSRIASLNRILKTAARKLREDNFDMRLISGVWKRYGPVRQQLVDIADVVPPEVWECLWTTLSADIPGNSNRMSHIFILARDMNSAGVALSQAQQLLAIEAMFIGGHRNDALQNWAKTAANLGASTETSKDYWALGVRMCSIGGDLERAERAADTLLASWPDMDPRFLLQIIRGYAAKDEKDKAYEYYRRLRDGLGSSMEIEDYDEVITCFLSAAHTEYALHVFVDMMFSGAVDIHGKTGLPSSVANNFFMGKWLKRLIGAGDLDGAYCVLEFMQRHQIMPAAIQVNGLIGAWLRSETAENQQKADDLAWALIESRQLFVELRRRNAVVEWPLRLYESRRMKDSLNFVPRANLETYCLMAENYKKRDQHRRLEELWVAFKEAEISTDAFMMNQVLESLIASGKPKAARELYSTMAHDHQILPNAYTFTVLFQSLAVNRLFWNTVNESVKFDEKIQCRQIFRDMIASSWAVTSREGVSELQSLGRLTLHTFRKIEDYAGLLVALHVFRAVFGYAPTEAVTLELVAETPSLRDTAKMRNRTILARKNIAVMLSQLRQSARSKFATGEDELDVVTPEELNSVIEMYFTNKMSVTEEEFGAMYQDAAQEMGVDSTLMPQANWNRL